MRKGFRFHIFLILMGLCLSLSAQKKSTIFQQKYEEAEVLANNSLYDVARTYYVEAYENAHATRQHKKIQNQIKQKIALMDCFTMYLHLQDQAKQLEEMQDFESADKYYADALTYAEYEHLNIPHADALKARSKVVSQTAELCKTLARMDSLNLEGDYTSARKLFRKMQDETEMLMNSWKNYGFPDIFIQKMDSIAHFLDNDRNTALHYRQIFPDEFKAMDNSLYHLLNMKATQSVTPIESDITFVFSLDTNGILEQYIEGTPSNQDFHDALLAELKKLKMRQPYRYGFSMPAREEVKYHVSSAPTNVWVKKTKKEILVKDDKLKKQYFKEFCKELSKAPEGNYCIQIHRNEIGGNASSSLRVIRAKGGKAKKWLKSL